MIGVDVVAAAWLPSTGAHHDHVTNDAQASDQCGVSLIRVNNISNRRSNQQIEGSIDPAQRLALRGNQRASNPRTMLASECTTAWPSRPIEYLSNARTPFNIFITSKEQGITTNKRSTHRAHAGANTTSKCGIKIISLDAETDHVCCITKESSKQPMKGL